MMRIGLFGGTFNPIHLGHLLVAQEVLEKFQLDRVVFIPVHLPPHKQPGDLASHQHRLHMVRLAVQGNRAFRVSDIEVRRKGLSFTVQTVASFHRRFAGRARIYFIIGADSLPQLHRWHRIREILRMCRMIIVPRPGISCQTELPIVSRELGNRLWRRIEFAAVEALDISSEGVRLFARRGKDITHLVTWPVARYIKQHRLYKGRR